MSFYPKTLQLATHRAEMGDQVYFMELSGIKFLVLSCSCLKPAVFSHLLCVFPGGCSHPIYVMHHAG